jgi:hypothetical protein
MKAGPTHRIFNGTSDEFPVGVHDAFEPGVAYEVLSLCRVKDKQEEEL